MVSDNQLITVGAEVVFADDFGVAQDVEEESTDKASKTKPHVADDIKEQSLHGFSPLPFGIMKVQKI